LYMIFEETKDSKRVKKSKLIIHKIDNILFKEIDNIKNKKNINIKNIKYINRYLKNNKYQELIIKHILELENRDDIIEFFNKTKIIENIIKDNKKNELKKAYYIYLIGEFKIQNKYNLLIKSCENKSIYVQVNTIRTLAKLGDYEYYIYGLRKILSSNSLIHKKVIIETFFLFNTINPILNSKLIEELSTPNSILSVVIINYFTSIKYEKVSSQIYQLMCNSKSDKEVVIASIRYFLENDFLCTKDILIKRLKDTNWEIRAISETALRKYNDEDVINALKESITDEVWYVRQNSARSLDYLIQDKELLFEIINKNDKYAYDAILSVLSESNDLDEYQKLKSKRGEK
ncbi:MAG: HEAT repeat domain-containing protein, partial [Romboutsia sp.]|nr:HEAT repeat domain-containing protein [Romboutsia sp.]